MAGAILNIFQGEVLEIDLPEVFPHKARGENGFLAILNQVQKPAFHGLEVLSVDSIVLVAFRNFRTDRGGCADGHKTCLGCKVIETEIHPTVVS
jgi:hypothetical protein